MSRRIALSCTLALVFVLCIAVLFGCKPKPSDALFSVDNVFDEMCQYPDATVRGKNASVFPDRLARIADMKVGKEDSETNYQRVCTLQKGNDDVEVKASYHIGTSMTSYGSPSLYIWFITDSLKSRCKKVLFAYDPWDKYYAFEAYSSESEPTSHGIKEGEHELAEKYMLELFLPAYFSANPDSRFDMRNLGSFNELSTPSLSTEEKGGAEMPLESYLQKKYGIASNRIKSVSRENEEVFHEVGDDGVQQLDSAKRTGWQLYSFTYDGRRCYARCTEEGGSAYRYGGADTIETDAASEALEKKYESLFACCSYFKVSAGEVRLIDGELRCLLDGRLDEADPFSCIPNAGVALFQGAALGNPEKLEDGLQETLEKVFAPDACDGRRIFVEIATFNNLDDCSKYVSADWGKDDGAPSPNGRVSWNNVGELK